MRRRFLVILVFATAWIGTANLQAGLAPPDKSNIDCESGDDGVTGPPQCCCYLIYTADWSDFYAPTGWTTLTIQMTFKCEDREDGAPGGIYSCDNVLECGQPPPEMSRPYPRYNAPCPGFVGWPIDLYVDCRLYDPNWCP